jgi:hypothetical protein
LPASTVPLTVPFRHIWAAKLNVTTTLSQKHYAEDILHTYGFWGSLPLATMLPPHTRLSKDDCDPAPERAFHLRYRGIVGSLGYLVNMSDLAFVYSELSKYVQRPGKAHMAAAEHTLRYLRGNFDKSLMDCGLEFTPSPFRVST